MAAMPLTKERRPGDDGSVFLFLFCWSDTFFIGALLFRWAAASRGPSRSELANVPPTFQSPRMEQKVSPLRNSSRDPPLRFSAMTAWEMRRHDTCCSNFRLANTIVIEAAKLYGCQELTCGRARVCFEI